MSRPVSIRRSMLNNMLLVVSLFAVAVLATTVMGANQMAATLSQTLIGQTISRTESQVREFISPVEHALNLAEVWVREDRFDPATGSGAEELLLPLLQEFAQLYGAILVRPDGRAMTLSRFEGIWRLSLVDADPDTDQVSMRILPGPAEWGTITYDLTPAERPWYIGAVEAVEGETFWTEAYTFFLSNQPGITASRRIRIGDQQWVVAFDVLLEDISEFSRNVDVGYEGMMVITDGHAQVIGLPNLPRFASASHREQFYLKHPSDLGFALAEDANRAFVPDPRFGIRTEPVRFYSDGRYWWGQGKWIPLNPSREIWAAVVVPESELLGNLNQLRILIISVTFLVTALAVTRAIVLARRYSQPIRSLAKQSLRYSSGNLDPGDPIESMLSEVQRLASAHERMRVGLASLLKLEDDLQLARQIQQKTFPTRFPEISGYDIVAGSRPADATGGDTFDVIGVRHADGNVSLADEEPDQVFVMLADATGHGMGPALTASQVRAMFRMGVRLGNPLQGIFCQMNDQLRADVHEGRFVTAFLARMDVREHRIGVLSAGQAPLLVYRAGTDEFEHLGADGPPMGVVDSPSEHPTPSVIALEPGDILVILSDGVFEAKSFDDQRFGTERVEQLIRVHRDRPVLELLNIIKDEIDRFMGELTADDDQTGILIKRL